MADLIGVLGQSSIAVVGTVTPYTVPSGKAAKCKFMYRGVAGVNSVLAVSINGIEVFRTGALTSGQVSYTTTLLSHNAQAASGITGGSDANTVAPGPKEYYLSEGDTVTYTITTNDFSSLSFQIVGTEVDVA